jgi:hypothetical protein
MKPKREHVTHDGRRYPIVKEASGTWRMRSRAATHAIDVGLGTTDLREAKRVALGILQDERAERRPRGAETVQDAIAVYLKMPKRCSKVAAEHNVGRLRKMLLVTWGKKPDEVKLHEIGPKLWKDFMKLRQGGTLDLSTRRPENAAINSAVRQACSLFIESLRPVYKEHGMTVPPDATTVQWLPMIKAPPPTADVRNLDINIHALKLVASDLYFCIGLARWAGLRRNEIKHCARHWIIEDRGQVYIELHDRPAEGYLTKTGQIYRAMVTNEAFAADLLALPDGMLAVNPATTDRDGWFECEPQDWVRPYTGTAKKPLHRLRGLYADEVKRITEEAVAARQEAIKAASSNLGHTTTTTTENHYLTP